MLTAHWLPIAANYAQIIGTLTFPFGIGVYLYHHNCHRHRCWRLSWHPDADGHPVCKHHHPAYPKES